MERKRFAVVGAGMGGLATALRLAHRGHQVTVFEKTDQLGGRNRQETVNECRFDGGPTLLMMLDPFRRLFADVGEDFEALVPIQLCSPTYRVFFSDGNRIDATTDADEMENRIATFSLKDAKKFKGFLREISALYDEAVPHFVRNNFERFFDWGSPPQLTRVVRHHMLSNLARRVHYRFEDERVRMLFSFQTMYLGLSPFHAPWVYATLAHMEYGEGIFYPQGGLPSIAVQIAELAKNRGCEIKVKTPVKRVDSGRVLLEDGHSLDYDAVICNADMPYARRELLGPGEARKLRYSCSALVLYLDYEGDIPELVHHNVLFGANFRGNLDAVFQHGDTGMPDDPAFYACVSKRSDPDAAPEGHLNLFLLIPCPNLDREFSAEVEENLVRAAFRRLSASSSFDPSRIRGEKRRTPRDWESELNLEKGAAFGISHDLFQSAFMRPANWDRRDPKVFYVGASTVPGNGLPMVLISAELVEQRLISQGVIAK